MTNFWLWGSLVFFVGWIIYGCLLGTPMMKCIARAKEVDFYDFDSDSFFLSNVLPYILYWSSVAFWWVVGFLPLAIPGVVYIVLYGIFDFRRDAFDNVYVEIIAQFLPLVVVLLGGSLCVLFGILTNTLLTSRKNYRTMIKIAKEEYPDWRRNDEIRKKAYLEIRHLNYIVGLSSNIAVATFRDIVKGWKNPQASK